MPDPTPNSTRGDRAVVLALFLAALLAYVATAAPGIVAEGDSSEYVAAAHVAGIPHAPGYPTYMLFAASLARVVSVERLARALNLASALFGALTVGVVTLVALRHARYAWPAATAWSHRGAAAVAGILLATATEFWNQSLSAEVYTLATLLLAVCLERLSTRAAPRGLGVAALAAGLAFGVHYNVAVPCALLVAAGAWRARAVLGVRGLARIAGAFVLGLATFLYLPLRSRADPALDFGDPETLAGVWDMLTLADMSTGKAIGRELGVLGRQIAAVAGLARQQWPAWAFALVAVGTVACATRRQLRSAGAAALALLLLVYAGILAMSNFALVDEEIYELRFLFLPAYVVLALLGGLGFASASAFLESRARGLAPAGLALLGVVLAPWAAAQRRTLDKRDNHVMREYGLGLLAAADGPALLFTFGDNAWMPLCSLQVVEDLRPDVTVVAAGLLRHEWYRRALVARDPALVLQEGAHGVAGLARTNLGRVNLYHADPRVQGLPGFEEIPSGLLRRIVAEGAGAPPVVPPAPELSPRWAPHDRRERSIRADTVNAYHRTAQWCRANGHVAAAEQALATGLALRVPEPRMEEFHLVRAALFLELGDLRKSQARGDEARTAWQSALDEAPATPPAELARKRLDAHAERNP